VVNSFLADVVRTVAPKQALAAGRFEEAVEKADELAKADFGVRLALYEAGQPDREA
jgi:hypothetical protein